MSPAASDTPHRQTDQIVITANIFTRVFMISCGDRQGTAFSIEVGARQYLVTARHVVESLGNHEHLEVFTKQGWKTLQVSVHICKLDDADTAVLAATQLLSKPLPVELSGMNGIVWGQDLYFLGFPLGMHGFIESRGILPLPFVKKAILSGITDPAETGGVRRLWLDGHNNRGFSGGPIVSYPAGGASAPRIVGVVSGYQAEKVLVASTETEAPFETNAGLVIAHGLEHALEIIDEFNDGFSIPPGLA